MQIKPADAERFLSRPDPAIRVVLIYGADDGLVAERSALFIKAVTGSSDDPFAHIRIEPSALSDDPRLLADEAHAVPLFGGRRVISIRLTGNWQILPALEPILAVPPVDAWVVIMAGDLRKTSPIRRLCEIEKGAAALPCYADNARDLDRVIDEETRAAKLTISDEARVALRDLIGGDRMQSRSEVAKLCLYAAGRGEIGIDDVRSIIGDAAAFATDEAVDAVGLGDAVGFARIYRRLRVAGTPGFVVAGAAIRHFGFLHRARAAFDAGVSPRELVARAMPPIFFKRRDDVERQISLWPNPRIERALAILDRAMIDSRLQSAISDDVIGQSLMLIATLAAVPKRAAS